MRAANGFTPPVESAQPWMCAASGSGVCSVLCGRSSRARHAMPCTWVSHTRSTKQRTVAAEPSSRIVENGLLCVVSAGEAGIPVSVFMTKKCKGTGQSCWPPRAA